MVLKGWFRILSRRWECLLMMGEGEREAGRQGGCSRELRNMGSAQGAAGLSQAGPLENGVRHF